jgi:hypothetical protein
MGAFDIYKGLWTGIFGPNSGATATNAMVVNDDGSINTTPTGGGTDQEIIGNVAHGAADSGNPVKIGGFGQATAPTAVDSLDRVNGWFGLNGQQVVALADIAGNLTDPTATVAVKPDTVTTAALTAVASAATSAQLLAANAVRRGIVIVNTDANALLIKYGTTASASSFTYQIAANGTLELPAPGQALYTGRIDGIWAADGAGSAFITEL